MAPSPLMRRNDLSSVELLLPDLISFFAGLLLFAWHNVTGTTAKREPLAYGYHLKGSAPRIIRLKQSMPRPPRNRDILSFYPCCVGSGTPMMRVDIRVGGAYSAATVAAV